MEGNGTRTRSAELMAEASPVPLVLSSEFVTGKSSLSSGRVGRG